MRLLRQLGVPAQRTSVQRLSGPGVWAHAAVPPRVYALPAAATSDSSVSPFSQLLIAPAVSPLRLPQGGNVKRPRRHRPAGSGACAAAEGA